MVHRLQENFMTRHDRAFWIFLLVILLIGVGVWNALFLILYHPILEIRDSFAVLETDYWTLSIQWPNGAISVWFTVPPREWRLWPRP